MSRRGQIQLHLQKLNEIGAIMRAIKNVSLMETHKLARFLDHQHRVVGGIEAAACDFVRHHPDLGMQAETDSAATILAIGAERGFCGDFNESVASALRHCLATGSPKVLVVGSRLAAKLEGDQRVSAVLEGPNVVEEVPTVLESVMTKLAGLHAGDLQSLPLSVTVLSHREAEEGVVAQPVSALPARAGTVTQEAYPPLLTLPAPALHRALVRHYLWAQMHYLFYSSLMAENRSRLQHMERAMQRMEEKAEEMGRRQNMLRQEEITEEIEIIMLNTGTLRVSGNS